jgi:hypothetical protein
MDSNDQITANHILQWLEIREKSGKHFPDSYGTFKCNIDHSSLLRRIAAGRKIFESPPPRSFSYPWYELMDNGEAYPYEVNVVSNDSIVINQMIWNIIENIDNNIYKISYEDNKIFCKLYTIGSDERSVWKLELIK